jgi:cytochrome c oxidase assembly protein subunit 15
LSAALVIGVAVQAVVGGITVLVELSPPVVMAHFLLSSVLLAVAAVLYHRAGEPDGPLDATADGFALRAPRAPVGSGRLRVVTKVMVGASCFVLFTGTMVTGAGPHGGDVDADRLDFHLPHITQVHTSTVWILVAATVVATVLAHREPAPAKLRTALGWLLAFLVAQGAVGYGQYFTGLPIGLIILHIIGSVLVWVTVVSVFLRTTMATEPTERPLVTAEAR